MAHFIKSTLIILFVIAGIALFQGQNNYVGWDDDPNQDKIPYEYFIRNMNRPPLQDPQPFILTDANGYDNFDMATDLAEGHISINPTNPLNIVLAFNGSGTLGSVPNTTTNGGLNWTRTNPTWGATMTGDPCTAFDSLGNFFFENMWNNPITGTKIAKSTTGSTSWVSAVPGNAGNDKNWLAADQTNGPYKNYIYSAMTNGGSCNFARSTDGGASFNVVTSLVPHGLPGAMPCVGPNGATSGGSVYVVTNAGSSFAALYTFHRSTDGGASFSTQTSVGWANYVGTNVGGRNSVENMRTRPYPFIAADNSYGTYRGRLYCVYASNFPIGDGNKPDIWCRYSTDFGVNWSSEVRVNDDANTQNNHQWHPAIWTDKSSGRLFVQWMDTRNCPTSDSCEMYATYSTNGGQTFVQNVNISTAKYKINCATCGGGGTPLYLGDYNGMASLNHQGTMCWTDFRQGSFRSTMAYFPDYAMKFRSTTDSIQSAGETKDYYVSIPGVKLFTGNVRFTAAITPTPAAGTVTITFLNKTTNLPLDSLTSYPDSLKVRVTTSGNVSTGNSYSLSVTASGTGMGIPVHRRAFTLRIYNPIGIISLGSEIPERFNLEQNYPNPFNPVTNIKFDIAKTGLVKLAVYDVTGREVAELVNGNYTAGRYQYDFNASHLASGIYFYKLETPNFTAVKKMIMVK